VIDAFRENQFCAVVMVILMPQAGWFAAFSISRNAGIYEKLAGIRFFARIFRVCF
jgi:hypothetical protein